MSVFDTIRALFSGGGAAARGRRLYVIDAARLAGSGSNERLSPRDQVQVLQQLGRFAQRENVKIQAVFEGRSLREVEHGGEFNGVKVFFADKGSAVPELMVDLVKSGLRGNDVVAVTANAQVEQKVLSAGGQTLRPSTFRKGMENGGGGGGMGGGMGGGGDRDRDRNRGRRQRQRGPRQPRPDNAQPDQGSSAEPSASAGDEQAPQQQQQAPSQPQPQQNPSREKDSVRDLIDLVE